MSDQLTSDTTGDPHAGHAPVGAVLVVGGGIAGMQSSLDLAEQGFKVYLVEAKSAIGGHMAQLDKTFPTNDCAMCTISPKLVETGRHPSIDILTQAEVLALDGAAGNFTARIRRAPRFVDPSKCVGCGDCEKVCPVELPDAFNENLNSRRAAFRLYPQAIPAAYTIEKKGVAPCRAACPAGQRSQGYIAHIRAGDFAEAFRVIKEDNPFPGICGRICNHPCETACVRAQVDDAVNIRALKRFVADWVYARERQPVQRLAQTRAERIAIIGAGPCGLTAAKDLVTLGYGVTVFDALPVAGGMLRVGVPEYRLPAAIIEREVQDIIDLGVTLRLNTRIDDLDELFADGFSAVLVAIGAHEGKRPSIRGADLPDVLVNTQFLRDVRLAEGMTPGSGDARIANKRVLVIGGGNVAIDCARTAVRLGAASVAMACLETRDKMPAHRSEIEEAEAEGVTFYPARSVTGIHNSGGRVTGVASVAVRSMAFDANGKLTLETEPGSERELACDTVIFSIGQSAGLAFIPPEAGLSITPRRTIAVDDVTFMGARPGLFAAGDATSGTAFVIEAIAAGHKVAASMHGYLSGEPLPVPPDQPVARMTASDIEVKAARGEISSTPRIAMAIQPAATRRGSFSEVESGFSETQARAEAARCLNCGVCAECLSCAYACTAKAIDHNDVERIDELAVGAVILAPGYQAYNARLSQEFGFGRLSNVVTSLQFERLLSAAGPTGGQVKRPSDGKTPKKIAFLQCIGSRDQTHDYCSAVCCMYAAKEAIMAKEHEPDTDVHVFMMDARAFSKNYQDYYLRARDKYGVNYHRCRISALSESPATRDLVLRYVPEDRHAAIVENEFDLVVLSVGMEISPAVRELGRKLGIELDDYGFCSTVHFDPLQTSRPGIYAAGPFREPKDIPESVVEASGAAGQAAALLSTARGTLAHKTVYPVEREISGEVPRVGVFVCHCGTNIAGFLDVPDVADYARTLPGVVHAENTLYACAQDSIANMVARAEECGLNRMVVASCSPRTHEPLFQDAMRQAGLNPYLFEMANIRNHCSWVHSGSRDGATCKAKDLVRMSVARVGRQEPLQMMDVPIERSALVIGGGAAGMTSALALAEQGFPVHLLERAAELGGNLRSIFTSIDAAADPQAFLRDTIARVRENPLITVHLNAEVKETAGSLGNFNSRFTDGTEIRHAVTIVATGGKEYRGHEYGYGSDARIVTQQQFEAHIADNRSIAELRSIVMIQCVGPAEKYCGRLCCTTALKNAIKVKTANPAADVTVLYKDIRTYGFKERTYAEARRLGVRFIRYDDEHPPVVEPEALTVQVRDPILDLDLTLRSDLIVLSAPMVPADGARELASKLKVPVDADGWFLEAHVKLRPVEFSSEGLYVAGAAHYPKFIAETIVQARAAASRAAIILSRDHLSIGGAVAAVVAEKCTGCLTCVRICPYHVPKIKADLPGAGGIIGAAYIEPTTCQGCGICASECPAKAINVMHYRDAQVMAKVDALFEGAPA
jgi:heterodisulfide reductase subunit A2